MQLKTPSQLIIGVICNGYNQEDIEYYSNEFRLIEKIFKEHVRVIFIGTDEEFLPPGTEYTKPVSINHYFKHIHALKIDLLFIPLQPGIFNQTSETLNKFFEFALFGIPVITINQEPYSSVINDKRNGFLYESRETFIAYLKEILIDNLPSVKMCGINAYETYYQNHTYSDENAQLLLNAID